MKRRITAILLSAALIAALAGCKSEKATSFNAEESADYDAGADSFGLMSDAAPGEKVVAESSEAAAVGGSDLAVSKSAVSERSGLMADGTADVAGVAPGEPSGKPEKSTADIEAKAGTLTAGEWKDNDNYDFFVEVLGRDEWKEYAKAWKLNAAKRFVVNVSHGQTAAKNVKVEAISSKGETLYTAYTDSYGKAYLYYDLSDKGDKPNSVRVYAAGGDDGYAEEKITEEELKAGGKTVTAEGEKFTKLDVMFTTDTTGSMSDELEYLKKELSDIISRTAADNRDYDIRVSVNFYRDEGDEYVVRSFAFEGDVGKVQKQIDEQFADGGGDMPEALHSALEDSVKNHEWREDAVKLLFLTLDAPGHREVQGVPESIRASVTEAAAKGIRIIPVAASGIDKETEFLLRAMAGATGGTYTFLTDDSGVGEAHLEPTIGDYNVKKLNELIIKIISEYCK